MHYCLFRVIEDGASECAVSDVDLRKPNKEVFSPLYSSIVDELSPPDDSPGLVEGDGVLEGPVLLEVAELYVVDQGRGDTQGVYRRGHVRVVTQEIRVLQIKQRLGSCKYDSSKFLC